MSSYSGKIFANSVIVERTLGINSKSIKRCCEGKQKTAGKLHWKWYKEDYHNGKL